MRGAGRAVVLLALTAAACGDPRNGTLLVLKVTTTLQAGAEVDQIVVTARPERGREKVQTFAITAQTELPITMGFVPEGSSTLSLDLGVVANLGGTERLARTVRVAFVPGEARQFVLLLAPCVGEDRACGEPTAPCDPELACVGRAERVALLPFPGPTVLPAVDAAVGDARADASVAPMDTAATPDTRDAAPPDLAGPDSGPLAGTWAVVPSETIRNARLAKIWPAAPNETWVVGSSAAMGVAYVHDGQAWAVVPLPPGTPPLNDVFAVRAGQVWMVGGGGTILRGSRTGMMAVPSGTTAALSGIWGPGEDDLVAVGAAGTVLQFRAGAWVTATSPARVNLVSVAGVGVNVWAVGSEGTILRRMAGVWAAQEQSVTKNPLLAVWAIRPDDVWAVGFEVALHYDGRSWSNRPSPLDTAVSVWGATSNDVWMVGRPSVAGASPIVRWDGARWTAAVTPPVMDPQAVRGLAQGNVWVAASGGQILRFQGR